MTAATRERLNKALRNDPLALTQAPARALADGVLRSVLAGHTQHSTRLGMLAGLEAGAAEAACYTGSADMRRVSGPEGLVASAWASYCDQSCPDMPGRFVGRSIH